jgi:hypothetical protein
MAADALEVRMARREGAAEQINETLHGLRDQIHAFRAELRDDIQGLRAEVQTVRGEFRGEAGAFMLAILLRGR